MQIHYLQAAASAADLQNSMDGRLDDSMLAFCGLEGPEGWRTRGQQARKGPERPPHHDLPGSGPNHQYLEGLRTAVAACGGLWRRGFGILWGPVAACAGHRRRTAPPFNTFTSKDGILEVLKSSMQRDLEGFERFGGLGGLEGTEGLEGLEDYEGRMD